MKSIKAQASQTEISTILPKCTCAACEECTNDDVRCEMWRPKRKFDKSEKEELKQALNGLSFSCGAQLQDADIPVQLKDIIFIRTMTCEDPNFIIPPNLRIYVYTVLLLRLHGVTLNCTTLSAGAVWTSLQSRTQKRNPRLKTCGQCTV